MNEKKLCAAVVQVDCGVSGRLCRMPSLSELLQEVRSRAEVCLYSGGRVAEVWAAVMDMANLPLPPCSKYHHIAAETMVIGNSAGSNRKEVREAWNTCAASTLRHRRVKKAKPYMRRTLKVKACHRRRGNFLL